ncbi:MAG TPA: hypothetical protein VHY08_20735 [Bacillota bacterium]|nr:hypothetical protein [Bacillota bacterium]
MGEFFITPLDGGLVVLVVMGVQALKKYLLPRWVPVLPFVISWILAIPAAIVAGRGVPSPLFLVSQVFLEGLKVAVLAMASYKLQYTTVLGKNTSRISVKKDRQ